MKKILGLSLVLCAPLITFAAVQGDGTVGGIIELVILWIGYIVPVLVTLAIGFFIWGVIQFMSASDEESKKLARTRIINGLIGLFVIVAFWGIIGVVKRTFGVNDGANYYGSVTEGMPLR